MGGVREIDVLFSWGGIGFEFFPYQIAVGISLRYLDYTPAFRLYVGPFKIWGYLRLRKRRIEMPTGPAKINKAYIAALDTLAQLKKDVVELQSELNNAGFHLPGAGDTTPSVSELVDFFVKTNVGSKWPLDNAAN